MKLTHVVVLVAVVAGSLAGCSAPAPPAPDKDLLALGKLMVQRLNTGDLVAASKWVTSTAIDDPAREKQVQDQAVAAANEKGIDPTAVQKVFAAQIEASKIVQRGLTQGWAVDPSSAPTAAPDLATQVRPRLDRIGADLIPAIGRVQDVRVASDCRARVARVRSELSRPLDTLHRAALTAALASVCDR